MDQEPRRVKMNTDGLKEYVAGDIEAVCHFVGDFAFCAREQGWTAEEVQRVVGRVTAKRAVEELMPYIEYVPPSVPPPPDSFRRYLEGCDLLADDPHVRRRPFRWLLRPLKEAIAQGRRRGWFSRPRHVERDGQTGT